VVVGAVDGATQQSAPLCQLLPVIPVARQLFVPQTRPAAHCLSSSQSPSLTLHGLLVVQQLQSVIGIPLQFGATVGAGVVVVVVVVDVDMQQSATEDQLLPLDEKSLRQLSLPHVILPKQSESLSQSPPPTSQGELLEQQLQSVIGTPLHCPAGGVPVDGATQQSALLDQLLPGKPVARQLFDPHTRVPAQSLSVSQSPSLTLH